MFESGGINIPVFYYVKPSDLRWLRQDGVYGKAFRIHEQKQRYSSETLQEWRNALRQSSSISGLVLEGSGYEAQLIRQLVKNVLNLVKRVPLGEPEFPIGMVAAEDDFVNTMLQPGSEGVKIVGITGTSGVGKTTLAKRVYNSMNSEYDRACFLPINDYPQLAANEGLQSLQRELLKKLWLGNLEINSTREGIKALRERLNGLRVLIILDNVYSEDQIKALDVKDVLRSGSLILVTSRHRDVLSCAGVASFYEVKRLNRDQAGELFCNHAFGHPHVPNGGFTDLVEQFLIKCDGVPKLLRTFGTLVHRIHDRSYWEELLCMLGKTKKV